MPPIIDTTDCSALTTHLRGAIHLPTSDTYHAARQVWNGMIDRHPAAVGVVSSQGKP